MWQAHPQQPCDTRSLPEKKAPDPGRWASRAWPAAITGVKQPSPPECPHLATPHHSPFLATLSAHVNRPQRGGGPSPPWYFPYVVSDISASSKVLLALWDEADTFNLVYLLVISHWNSPYFFSDLKSMAIII